MRLFESATKINLSVSWKRLKRRIPCFHVFGAVVTVVHELIAVSVVQVTQQVERGVFASPQRTGGYAN